MRANFPTVLALSISCAFSLPTAAKEPYATGTLLNIVSTMPEGTWVKVNTNFISDVWTPADQRPLNYQSNPPPDRVISAWAGYAWDSNRGDLIIYGGGHANYSGNDVYRWRSRNLQWERASLPSEITRWGSTVYFWAKDGADAAPPAAHTYDNAVFLPLLDRYMNYGGASYNTGGPYSRLDENDSSKTRRTGPYMFDPAKANGNQVGGTTGSHVQRVAPLPDVIGGNMWLNRDHTKNLAGKAMPQRHVNGCTGYVEENGTEVVYLGAGASPDATSPSLYRHVLGELSNAQTDDIGRIGIYWNGTSDLTTCAVDPVRKVFVRTGNNTKPFVYWNLATAGPTNKDQAVVVSDSVATFSSWLGATGKSMRLCAIDYDPNRQHFVLWCGDGALWSLVPPSTIAPTGWTMEQLPLNGGDVPPGRVGTGILGKWKYIPGFDVFLGLQHETEGQIWIYKPTGWMAPNTNNVAPTVSIDDPVSGSEVIRGQPATLLATAADSDGTVSRVDFKVNGTLIGSVTSPPYTVNWTPTALGSASIKAIATDNSGAETESAVVDVVVTSGGAGGPVTTTLQRGLDTYSGSSDVYLSSYSTSGNTGATQNLLVFQTKYTPLIKFAIFAREGGPLPDDAVIESAKLSIYKSNYDFIYRLHPMLRDWKELEATWLRPKIGESWTSPGAAGVDADYTAAYDAQFSAPFSPGWMIFDVSARVSEWQQGQNNYGWRIVGVSGNGNLKQFYSSEYATNVTLRPKLEITYTLP